jgi:hypothetical protein
MALHRRGSSSMYSMFPFDFHERFRSIDRPFLSPTQYKKREHPSAALSSFHKPSGWQVRPSEY